MKPKNCICAVVLLLIGVHGVIHASQHSTDVGLRERAFHVMREHGYFSLEIMAPDVCTTLFRLSQFKVLKGHNNGVSCLAYNNGGEELFSGGLGIINRWNLASV